MELSNLLWSVAAAAPSLIVYTIAGIMGIVFLNKHKSAALLAMLGGLLAGITVLGSLVIRELMWAGARKDGDMKATAELTRYHQHRWAVDRSGGHGDDRVRGVRRAEAGGTSRRPRRRRPPPPRPA